jgi:hypothetical protein
MSRNPPHPPMLGDRRLDAAATSADLWILGDEGALTDQRLSRADHSVDPVKITAECCHHAAGAPTPDQLARDPGLGVVGQCGDRRGQLGVGDVSDRHELDHVA